MKQQNTHLEGMYNDSEMELIDPQWIIENYGNKFGKSKK